MERIIEFSPLFIYIHLYYALNLNNLQNQMKHIINIKTTDEFNDLKDSLNRPNVILLKEENNKVLYNFKAALKDVYELVKIQGDYNDIFISTDDIHCDKNLSQVMNKTIKVNRYGFPEKWQFKDYNTSLTALDRYTLESLVATYNTSLIDKLSFKFNGLRRKENKSIRDYVEQVTSFIDASGNIFVIQYNKEENKLTVNDFETYKNNYVPDYKIKLMINISDTL